MNTTIKKHEPLLLNILHEKCPHCREGRVFAQKEHWYQIMPKMNKECECCHYKFDREPGYFLGAMYVSYALSVAYGVATFVTLNFFFPTLDMAWDLAALSAVIILMAPKNYKLSRIIYMHIFPW